MTEQQIFHYVATELKLSIQSVISTVKLLDEGATVPFITRYRQEVTGGMNEEQIRDIQDRVKYIRILEERKETILASIDEQGKLTDDLKNKIINCIQMTELEDLYLPYRPKRKTKATVAKAKGLEPLAEFIFNQQEKNFDPNEIVSPFISSEKDVNSFDEAVSGAKDIIAEWVGEHAEYRKNIREVSYQVGKVTTCQKDADKKDRTDFEIYYEFSDELKKMKPHQILALNRGEREGILKVTVDVDEIICTSYLEQQVIRTQHEWSREQLKKAIVDSYGRLIQPSIEREIRNSLTDQADLHAIEVFAKNLKNLLLQPPIYGKMIMGIDPGFVSGCKVAIVDTTGKYLEGETIYPTEPRKWIDVSEKIVSNLIKKYKVELVAIGNGTGSREVEQFISDTIKKFELNCNYLIVSEAGASVYSASKIAAEEFPDLEAAQRGNISIARRVIDPLSELVKIDPKSIGVGLYQHDVNQKTLEEKLDQVVESVVNHVGVNLNTASISLLTHVSGLNKRIASNIINYREKIGRFKNREELKKVAGIGESTYTQAAGFLKIEDGDNPLDATSIHPESYEVTIKLLETLKMNIKEFKKDHQALVQELQRQNKKDLSQILGVGLPTLELITENLKKPGRDPREDMPKPIFRSDVLKIEDLRPGMRLKGTVRNVIDFGAFVDIGVKQDGLLHISEMGDVFVKNPHDVLSVGDVIDVTIKTIEMDRQRIALTRKGTSPQVPNSSQNQSNVQNKDQQRKGQQQQKVQPKNDFADKLSALKEKFGK